MEPGTRFLSTPNAAAYLTVKYGHGTAKTLDTLRCRGGGPAFRRIGRFVVYETTALDAWAAARLSKPLNSTSEAVEG
jgi:hypothetical protein